MTENKLRETLKTKKPIAFKKDGTFRILFFSDIHCFLDGGDMRSLDAMEGMIEDKSPDLVLWAGDGPAGAKTRDDLIKLIKVFSLPMESRGIPWAITNGNHASATCRDLSLDEIEEVFENCFDFCVTKHVEGIHGNTNYVLPVYSSKEPSRIALNVFSLDTGNDMSDIDAVRIVKGRICSDVIKRALPVGVTAHNYDIIRFDQLAWYWDVSSSVEKINGKTPAIMFTHCCPHEAKIIRENPEETKMVGNFTESIRTGPLNSGVFATVVERGDVIGFYFGHNHNNTAEGTYCGIRMGYVGSVGYEGYGVSGHTDAEKNKHRGARLLSFTEEDILNYSSEYLFSSDYVKHYNS
ncbi:MAG: metallophosphoesterase [Clostridia bacterium]|nr:metallophosphoesterase [Clostridia bacterium]